MCWPFTTVMHAQSLSNDEASICACTRMACCKIFPQALAADKAAAAHERELEVARLRALQEKVQDTRSQEDELRAKRYQVRVQASPHGPAVLLTSGVPQYQCWCPHAQCDSVIWATLPSSRHAPCV